MKKMQYIQPKAESVTISAENAILQASLLVFELTDGVAAENYDDVILGTW
jgi:hypothetical protein